MISPVKTTIPGTVHLKIGQKLSVVFNPDREFTGDSLTSGTLQTFITQSGQKYLVQGDNIALIEVSE